MSGPSFDSALGQFCQVIVDDGFMGLLESGFFVRDIDGTLQFVVPDGEHARVEQSTAKVLNAVGKYAKTPPDTIAKLSSTYAQDRIHQLLPERLTLRDGEVIVRVLDLRSAGQDWLNGPLEQAASPPRLVFWSLKGGVGRTTALVALAAALARTGNNVLVVDLDLEAPGVGDLLLSPDAKPQYGVVDYLVEDLVGSVEEQQLIKNMVATSSLVEGAGLIDVCPAGGLLAAENPQNYMAKLFRAYPPKRNQESHQHFAERINRLVSILESEKRYDAVLIDARAGMNESTAAALLGLGADVLIFGHDTPQTFAGYRYAFAHLGRFALKGDGEWRLRLKMVHAKAPVGSEAKERFRDNAFELFAEWLYETEGDFSFSPDDEEAPHFPWVVLDDSNYRDFDPLSDSRHLDGAVFSATFGDFIKNARTRLRVDKNE